MELTTLNAIFQKLHYAAAKPHATLTHSSIVVGGTLEKALPNAKLQTLAVQTHIIKPAVLAPVLVDYLSK